MGYKACEDLGHGGYDSCACGNDLEEKDITLDICLRAKALMEYNGIEVIMTARVTMQAADKTVQDIFADAIQSGVKQIQPSV